MNVVGMLKFELETTTASAAIDFGDDGLRP
jgi:hypothetical protein